ncbi:YkoF family thiamine/hydroxymethylpyrimidine-binding protein [Thiomicrorhabdus sp. ZW0627]|uniref:YkoF family thiamine/hydroxymethylpyrimidine-binding protein n=1 Tax=Thiomicrorhabdus sp. ZW0627 TaxID=3039774 RepID=UPI002436C2B1|nr:YkoF family thiamine/hydroxymethylpyrimidine-binding protein [Thiomicrorhabdus sp. ZW0627]MDG6774106.1 YkoF family thiamine/hydroxymethylpyrimidine-binding protein [Thiomicrorhabdus sp. ZW0627]
MKISVDISMYPLQEDYCQPILDFIARLEQNPDLTIARNSLSTQVFGDFDSVMKEMNQDMKEVLEKIPHSVFVLKIVGVDRSAAVIDACK